MRSKIKTEFPEGRFFGFGRHRDGAEISKYFYTSKSKIFFIQFDALKFDEFLKSIIRKVKSSFLRDFFLYSDVIVTMREPDLYILPYIFQIQFDALWFHEFLKVLTEIEFFG